MGCSSEKNTQTNEENNQKEQSNKNNEELDINQKQDLDEENQDKKEQEEEIKPQTPEDPNKKDDEDAVIQEDENQKVLLGNGEDSSDKLDQYNSKGDFSNNLRQSKSNNKNKNKKPFIITLLDDSSYKKIKILFNACAFIDECLMPIWCPKNAFIKFKVKGKWRIDKLYPYTDSKGLPSNNKGGFGYGALIGRIGKGEKFIVSDEKAIFVEEEGPLYMKQILPKNMKVEPEGSLEVFVYDGEFMDINEINEKIGWIENNDENEDENNQNDIFDDNSIRMKKDDNIKKDFENKIRNEMNNLRMNSMLFYEHFINKTNNKKNNLTQSRKYLEKISNEYLGVLNSNEDYYNAISTYFEIFNQSMNKKNLYQNNITDFLIELEKEIELFLIDKFERKTKVKCRLTQKSKAKDIIIQCFYDKKYRFYIFNKKCLDLTVNIINNFFKNFNLIIMAFTLEPPSEVVFK